MEWVTSSLYIIWYFSNLYQSIFFAVSSLFFCNIKVEKRLSGLINVKRWVPPSPVKLTVESWLLTLKKLFALKLIDWLIVHVLYKILRISIGCNKDGASNVVCLVYMENFPNKIYAKSGRVCKGEGSNKR